jgi:hypothetical protein
MVVMNIFAQGNLGELIISAMHHTISIYVWFLCLAILFCWGVLGWVS